MKIKWLKERQYSRWGLIESGEVLDTKKVGIPKRVAEKWVQDGWAEEIKPSKVKEKKSKSNNGGK